MNVQSERPGEEQGTDRRAANIVLFNIPADGHVNPNLAFAAKLVRRGHRVSFSIDERHAPQVRATGATPVVYDTTFPRADRWERFPLHDVIEMSSLFLDEAIAVLPQQRKAFEDARPDLVLYDYAALSAQVLAHEWGVPAVRLSPTRVSSRTYEEDLAPFYASVAEDERWRAYRRRFRRWLDDAGIGMPVDRFLYVGFADHCVVTVPRQFQADATEQDTDHTFVGPVVREQEHQEPWVPPAGGRPVPLVAFGTIAPEVPQVQRVYFECLEAFADSPWHVVMSIGRQLDPEVFGELPGNIELLPPQLQILAHADAFVTHAGMGSVMEAIHHAVPLIAVPMGFDQTENARVIERLGIGARLPFEGVTGQEIRKAADEVRGDPEVGQRRREGREDVRRAGGARPAGDAIERLLTRRQAGEAQPLGGGQVVPRPDAEVTHARGE
ncbi:UDP glycosyltransferase [Streptomyces capoamus]|uniref:UDP glycosyltransferase n=1 Tax=Streptomyces capoamus TaxID=68183 RepID=A0A919KFY4_9ACTN|nr:macrolide family glycosyltransferase [Streptomyces capoamus]GGW13124.1 UDP glycosyltransferase [Streptomyces libani subsp. rufus]GHG77911.1 UDP glycosyltransferase [Streptomyces capoamus]